MSDNDSSNQAFLVTGGIFASNIMLAIGFVINKHLSMRSHNHTTSSKEKKNHDSTTTMSIEEEDLLVDPHFPPHKRLMQKVRAFFSNHNTLFSICMIFFTFAKSFLQTFDMVTDILVADTFWVSRNLFVFVVSIVLISSPVVAKWRTMGDFITKKCDQKHLPEWVSWVQFTFPIGFFMPFIFDAYIVAEVLEGHIRALSTGTTFKLEDSLFSVQRSFALSEIQIESFPQALFQSGVLLYNWITVRNANDASLVILSITMSLANLAVQILSLRTLAEKESFPSIFSLIQSLSRGDFIAGINRIRNSRESVLNLYDTYLDKVKMNLVRDLLHQRPNLRTVILNPNMLLKDSEFNTKWLWDMNTIQLKFLCADSVEDLDEAIASIDINKDGLIHIDEFEGVGSYARRTWLQKFGFDYEMNTSAFLNFLRTENVKVNHTTYSLFDIVEQKKFSESIQRRAWEVIDSFFLETNLTLDHDVPLNEFIKNEWNKSTGDIVAFNGSSFETLKLEFVSLLNIRCLTIPNLVDLNLEGSNVTNIDIIANGYLPKLKFISFERCSLLNDLYFNVANLPSLEELNLANSNWRNAKVILESDDASLKKVDFGYCKSLDSDAVEFIGLPHLEELNFCDSNWRNAKVILESDNTSLKKVVFGYCKSLDSDAVEFIGLPHLEELNLVKSNWKNAKVILQSDDASLKKVGFGYCTSLDSDAVKFIGLPHLEELNLANSNWKNAKVILESDDASLKKVIFRECKSLDSDAVKFIGLPHLEELNFFDSNWRNAKVILESDNTSLKKVVFGSCTSLDSDAVEFIGLPHLEKLCLGGSNWKNANVILESDNASLKKVDFDYCKSLDSDAVKFIGLPHLEELNFFGSNWRNVKVILESDHARLKKVHFGRCQSLDGDAVEFIGLPHLEELDLKETEWKNANVILESDHASLKKVIFRECKSLDSDAVKFISLPHLEELNFFDSNWRNAKVILESDNTSLKKVVFRSCTSLDSDAVEFIGLPHLEVLDFYNSNWRNVKVILESDHASLKNVNFTFCEHLDGDAVKFIGLPHLEELDLNKSNWKNAKVILENGKWILRM